MHGLETHTEPPPPPPAVDQPEMTAGRYLRLRREAAKATIADAAAAITPTSIHESAGEARVEMLERDEVQLYDEVELSDLMVAFEFDADVYANLRDGLPAGRICTSCGCTWNDPCPQGCAWTSASVDLCTACAKPRSVGPVHAAFDDVALFGARDVAALVEALDGVPPAAAVLCDDDREIIGIVYRTRTINGVERKEIILVCDFPDREPRS